MTFAKSCIIALAFGASLLAQTVPLYDPPTVYTPKQMTPFTQYCPLWRTDGTFESTIQLSNQLVTAPIDAIVTLFMQDGTPYVLPPVHLKRSSVATVNVNTMVAKAPTRIFSHLSTFGSASIEYRYGWQGVVFARMSILNVPASLQYSYPFVFPMGTMNMAPQAESLRPVSTVVEGLTWHYSRHTNAFVALSNTSSQDIHISMAVLDQAGTEKTTQAFTLPPANR